MATKKTFKDNLNPAMQFISTPEAPAEQSPQRPQEKPPEGYKLNPLYLETKSKRLQLLVQPSLLEKVKAQAKARETSVNDYVHSILEEATREER